MNAPARRPTKRNGPDGDGALFAWATARGQTVAFPPGAPRSSPLVVSYGLGVDSTAMLVLLWRSGIRPDLILFADTGSERPETMAYLDEINRWLAAVGFPLVTVVRYTQVTYGTLYDNCVQMGMLPSLAYGGHMHGCSLKWKVGPLDKFVGHWPPARAAWKAGLKVVRAIGYDDSAADNARRGRFEAKGGEAVTEKYRYWYPLQDAHWDRDRCMTEIAREGLRVPPKSACFFCPSTKPHEVIELVLTQPELAWKIIEMERGAGANLAVIDGLWGTGTVGTRGGVPKPGSMAEYILQWMVDGRAYQRLPQPGDKGIVAREVQGMANVGRVYRLPMAGEPGDRELAALSQRGRAAALALRARFEQRYGSVEAFLAAGHARGVARKVKATAKRRAATALATPKPPKR